MFLCKKAFDCVLLILQNWIVFKLLLAFPKFLLSCNRLSSILWGRLFCQVENKYPYLNDNKRLYLRFLEFILIHNSFLKKTQFERISKVIAYLLRWIDFNLNMTPQKISCTPEKFYMEIYAEGEKFWGFLFIQWPKRYLVI